VSVEIPASGSSVPAVTEPAAPVSPEPAAIRVPLKVKLSLLITALVVLAVALVGLFLLRQQQQRPHRRDDQARAHHGRELRGRGPRPRCSPATT